MVFRLMKVAARWVVPSGAAVLMMSLAVSPVCGQQVAFGKKSSSCPTYVAPAPCPAPAPAPTPAPQPEPTPAPAPAPAQEPAVDPLAFGATGGGESFSASAPNVIGDGGVSATGAAAMRLSALKITENQSPRPANRIYFSYNHFYNVQKSGVNVDRYMPGFEQTFLGGNASFGGNIPVYGTNNDGAIGIQGFGNLNMIGKYAFVNTADTVLTGGMSLTAPTGRTQNVQSLGAPGFAEMNSWFFQPYGAYVFNGNGDLYLQGFSSLAIPTDARDITIMFNDIAAGYWLIRSNQDRFLTGVIPTLEGHLNTPLTHRNPGGNGTFGIQDSFVLTAGSHFIVRQRGIVTLGVATPLTGPKPFDAEGIAQFNLRY